jgi:SAM-dependent methyltransferase
VPEEPKGADDWRELNRTSWEERVPIHVTSPLYRTDEFVEGREPLHRFEVEELGDLAGKEVVHLQCHFGMDTISLGRKGARVTGLDFSATAVEAARRLAADVGIEATFVESDVYDAPSALGTKFDVVYTGKGALNWLPDMSAWAETVSSLLRPGGVLYLVEFHPLTWMLSDERLEIEYSYFNDGPMVWDDPRDYADPDVVLQHERTVEWAHPISEIVTAVIAAGLRVDFLHEFAETGFQRFTWLEETAPSVFTMPADRPSIPLMYSLRASKTA